jgi:hypothetical protein
MQSYFMLDDGLPDAVPAAVGVKLFWSDPIKFPDDIDALAGMKPDPGVLLELCGPWLPVIGTGNIVSTLPVAPL